MSKIPFLLFTAAMLVGFTGCAGRGRPAWLGDPASLQLRVQEAQRVEPYPESDVGPDISETRPAGFEHNVAEPKRARWWQRKGYFGQ
ncbi:MAG: hypothetical protein N2C14_04205 [Planctomycetales bacterium]